MERRIDHLSVSQIQEFLTCPAKWYFHYQARGKDYPLFTTYPLLTGHVTHSMIDQLHQPHPGERRYYFKTEEAFLNSATSQWYSQVEQQIDQGTLINANRRDTNKFLEVIRGCLRRYWGTNYNQDDPTAVEQRYNIYLPSVGIPLVGILDQIRQVPLEYISRKRPDLIGDSGLVDGFDPVVVVDLKTNYRDYGFGRLDPNLSDVDKVRFQYPLHRSIQASAYTLLYFLENQRMPIGFVWYHLRSGGLYFTYRTAESFLSLEKQILFMLDNIEAGSFPQNFGDHCRECSFLYPCQGDIEPFLISEPDYSFHQPGILKSFLIPQQTKKEPEQLKFQKLKVVRRKRQGLDLTKRDQHPVREIPPFWNQPRSIQVREVGAEGET